MRRAAFIAALFAGYLRAQTSPAPAPDLDRKIAATLQVFGAPSVSVAAVKDGHIIYDRAFGKANIEENRAAAPDTRYAVGSISKQFTAAGLLLEQEHGKVSLNDKVSKYFPDLTRANEITIRELLSHTSGYEDYAPQDYLIPEWTKPITPLDILNRWAKKPLNFEPGTQWQYSNTNYVLAGEILEKVSGQPLLAFLNEHFFGPLHMTSAGDCEVHSPADASAYTRYALGPPRPVGREANGWYFAAGELCMTASDLARWDAAFLEKRILSARSYEEFTRPVKLKNGKSTGYALGLQVGESNGVPVIRHSGEVSGFLALNMVFPTKKAGVVVLSNEDGVNLIGPVGQEIAGWLLKPPGEASEQRDAEIRQILEDLQQGRVDRSKLTANANSYFTEQALKDYRDSLAPLGKFKLLVRDNEQQRGGMTHLTYHAHFENRTVVLNLYVMPDGKFEQFLVEEQF